MNCANRQAIRPHLRALGAVIQEKEFGLNGSSRASPSVRKMARDLGMDITRVQGTGAKGRITQDDVVTFVKGVMTGALAAPAGTAAAPAAAGAGLNLLPCRRSISRSSA